MSLSLTVRIYDQNGEYTEIELERGKDLAGGDRLRYKLYSSDLAESLGIKLLPELNKGIYTLKLKSYMN